MSPFIKIKEWAVKEKKKGKMTQSHVGKGAIPGMSYEWIKS